MFSNNNEKTDDSPVQFDEALERTGNGLYNITLAVTCAMTLMAIGADLFGFSIVIALACDLELTVSERGILTSLPFIGILLVSYFWGYVSDTRGRKFTLSISMQVSFVLSCLCSLAPNWITLAFMKFLAVCFSCASNSATYTLVGESCVQRVRNKYMLLMTSLLLLSPAAAALLTYPIMNLDFAAPISWLSITFRPWRLLCIILALPSGLCAVAIQFFHESPKFLANCGRDDEALKVLKSMYAVNNWGKKEEFDVKSIQITPQLGPKYGFTPRGVWEQSAPLFRPPLLRRTIQLFYIVAVVYITNNSFLVWLPTILNLVKVSLEEGRNTGAICELISFEDIAPTTVNSTESYVPICRGVEENTIFTLMISQAIFSFLNFVISHLPNKRRIVLISILCLSSISGFLLNFIPNPIASVVVFMVFTCTCLGMGILASYFVDFYPTSYRGMVACLSIMVGRTSTFVGINVVGNLLFSHCNITFYFWAVLVASSAVAAWFLPPDKPPQKEITKL